MMQLIYYGICYKFSPWEPLVVVNLSYTYLYSNIFQCVDWWLLQNSNAPILQPYVLEVGRNNVVYSTLDGLITNFNDVRGWSLCILKIKFIEEGTNTGGLYREWIILFSQPFKNSERSIGTSAKNISTSIDNINEQSGGILYFKQNKQNDMSDSPTFAVEWQENPNDAKAVGMLVGLTIYHRWKFDWVLSDLIYRLMSAYPRDIVFSLEDTVLVDGYQYKHLTEMRTWEEFRIFCESVFAPLISESGIAYKTCLASIPHDYRDFPVGDEDWTLLSPGKRKET